MTEVIIASSALGYCIMMGVTAVFLAAKQSDNIVDFDRVAMSVFWPIILPVMIGIAIGLRITRKKVNLPVAKTKNCR